MHAVLLLNQHNIMEHLAKILLLQIQVLNMDMNNIKRRAISYSKHNSARAGKYKQHPMMKQDIRTEALKKNEIFPYAALMIFEKNNSGLSVK